ncbi:27 kDa glycoprotein-like [Hyposmocoma kahamanoa]|uniref:27 kDa glycoprotein-like n=1 Tax=Hyposmocoma kahamanoa TaxID=1477025 RepID=UPI000E6D9FC0|nr:27 kDa glycoprotein-like [Hyposmocoma kahamanoa]XP_026333248.1 27 kDa glycoprotein-like [Hyposmocoma kahamanoa]
MIWKTLFIALLAVGAYAEVQIPNDQAQYDTMLSNYCTKNGASEHLQDVKAAITAFGDCLKGLIDIETITDEIKKAMPNGELDEVFKKYCEKTPQLKNCLYTMLEGVKPCMDSAIRSHIGDIKNGTSQLLEFICYKDGDRIALFYAEGGPACLQSKIAELRDCGQKLKDSVSTVEEAKAMSLDTQCHKYDELTSCMVTELEKCDTPTPGNMAESLFKYIRNTSPCPKKN